ncbi:radical SAM protein [bacterium]|nr:radical SAM protein [bacterium]
MSNILAYLLDGKIYINLTNKCTNDCIFCLRKDKDDVCGQTLWLEDENSTAQDVIEQFMEILKQVQNDKKEVIFCGYGEPMLKFEVLKEVAKYIKEKYPQTKIRVNTNGHANFVYKRNLVPELKGLVDEFSVSLNGATKDEYDYFSNPKFLQAYEETKKFILECSTYGIPVVASVVDGYKGKRLNINECERIANSLGAKLRVREWIQNGY